MKPPFLISPLVGAGVGAALGLASLLGTRSRRSDAIAGAFVYAIAGAFAGVLLGPAMISGPLDCVAEDLARGRSEGWTTARAVSLAVELLWICAGPCVASFLVGRDCGKR